MIPRRVIANGAAWTVRPVPPSSPLLVVDGTPRLAATHPAARLVAYDMTLEPPLLDRVILHESAHVLAVDEPYAPRVDEQMAQRIERDAILCIDFTSRALGRPPCVDRMCAQPYIL